MKSPPRAKLDTFDKKILRTLATDGRISWRALANKINLTLTPTLRRVRRLEAEGYITGYMAVLDEPRLLGNIVVSLLVKMQQGNDDFFEQFEQAVLNIPQVIYCGRYEPFFDYIVNIYATDMNEVSHTIQMLSCISGIWTIDVRPMLRIARHMKPLASWPGK